MTDPNPTADLTTAARFVDGWLAAWNSHDVERLVSMYADDAVFTSPLVARMLEGSDGSVHGQHALRAYFSIAIERYPQLELTLLDFYLGIDRLVINYRNHRGGLVNEVLDFDGPLVCRGHGTYSEQSPSWVSQLRRIANAVPPSPA